MKYFFRFFFLRVREKEVNLYSLNSVDHQNRQFQKLIKLKNY